MSITKLTKVREKSENDGSKQNLWNKFRERNNKKLQRKSILHETFKLMERKKEESSINIKDKEGEIITETEKILK